MAMGNDERLLAFLTGNERPRHDRVFREAFSRFAQSGARAQNQKPYWLQVKEANEHNMRVVANMKVSGTH